VQQAQQEGRFRAIVPVEVKGGRVDRISTDEHPRDSVTLDNPEARVFGKRAVHIETHRESPTALRVVVW
jgi:hypothetical protein